MCFASLFLLWSDGTQHVVRVDKLAGTNPVRQVCPSLSLHWAGLIVTSRDARCDSLVGLRRRLWVRALR